ncbi:MAG TPA: amino acid adenylation domain-containing protein, partial [Thermodesulfovibrionales bacterium]|nr:amino acid adenylation domain-containing protein [Thermodesulfovibrionales bacterium]
VVFEDQQLTYRELNSKANQLAHYLRKCGVGPEVLVGICVERSLEMIIGILGILKAGGAYVPLDPTYPKERLKFMLEDSQAAVLLTQGHLIANLFAPMVHVLHLDRDWPVISGGPSENPDHTAIPGNLIYVIYTSGSTGRPKGCCNSHRGVGNMIRWSQEAFQMSGADRMLQTASFSFDISAWEVFLALTSGATLILTKPGGHMDPCYLIDLIDSRRVTLVFFVPSMLSALLGEDGVQRCRSLRRVFCGGEALSSALQQRFFSRLEAELHNLYGPTEAAIFATHWQCQRQDCSVAVPIGRPVANTHIYVLDNALKPAPVGVTGELCIGGVQVARGYLNCPEITAEKFISDPFSRVAGSRLYRTGDRARYRADGAIEFLGRLDHQVKIRGFRIELGEIEAALGHNPAVREAVVIAGEGEPGDKRLVAYVVFRGQGKITESDLRSHLSKQLPDYMIPSAFVVLDALPLTPNGKVDRKSLPTLELGRPDLEDSFVAPRTPVEELVAGIWCEVLGLKKVGIHDNFFLVGGHSLLATQVVSRLRKTLQQEVPLRFLFESPTPAGLAMRITQSQAENADPEELARILDELEAPAKDSASAPGFREKDERYD